MTTTLILLAVASIVAMFAYTLAMWLESRSILRHEVIDLREVPDVLVVFLVPCLDEERVIGGTLDRLLACPVPNRRILVIDDDSSDRTAEIVEAHDHPDVRLLRRRAPDAQLGKGAALNAAVQHLRTSGELQGWSDDRVIIALVDADGRLDPEAPARALLEFHDRRVGGAQIAVRIENRDAGLLTRLQDMEFVGYTEIFQVPRSRLGYAGLGGNGQFARLSALLDVGDEPWSDSLTEDLDLGVRLVLAGWETRYVPEVAVHQQGLTAVGRLVRQRSRWFQGTLQAWPLVPSVARRCRPRVAVELAHTLLSPALVVLVSAMVLSLVCLVAGGLLSGDPAGTLLRPAVLVSWYALAFLPTLVHGLAYASRSEVGRLRAVVYAHAYVVYALLWLASGWWAFGRMARGRTTWFKTERLTDDAPVPVPAPIERPAAAPVRIREHQPAQ